MSNENTSDKELMKKHLEELKEIKDTIVKDMIEELEDLQVEKSSINWFILGIALGISGNLFVSAIFELLKIGFNDNWHQVLLILSFSTMIPIIYVLNKYYKRMKEIEGRDKAARTSIDLIYERIKLIEKRIKE